MNEKIKQFIAFGICSVVALALCLGVLVVTVKKLDSGANVTESKTIINKTELNSSKEVLTRYINGLITKTDNRFVKTKTYTNISVADLKVLNSTENRAKDETLFNFAKDKMLSAIDSYYAEDFAGSFEKADSKKLSLILNKKMLKNAEFSIGQVNEDGETVFDDEGNIVDNEYYYLSYEVDIDNQSFNNELAEMLSVENDASAKKQFINEVKDNCKIDSFEVKPDRFIIKAKVNRSNDEIQYINVIRQYAVTFGAEFINDAEPFGKKEISFIYTVTDTYEYAYAGILFVENEVEIKLNEEYMLNVVAIIDDDSDYSVEFSSSGENVTVDEMGYVKALNSEKEPVTITVELNYLGEKFTDTCIVNIVEE